MLSHGCPGVAGVQEASRAVSAGKPARLADADDLSKHVHLPASSEREPEMSRICHANSPRAVT